MTPVDVAWTPMRFGRLLLELPASMAANLAAQTDALAANDTMSLRVDEAELGQLELTIAPVSTGRQSLRERLPPISESLAARGVELHKQRSRPRVAAGLNGEEVAVSIQQGTATHGIFIWHGTGQMEGADARVVLQLALTGDSLDRKQQIWDHLLDSLTQETTT